LKLKIFATYFLKNFILNAAKRMKPSSINDSRVGFLGFFLEKITFSSSPSFFFLHVCVKQQRLTALVSHFLLFCWVRSRDEQTADPFFPSAR
jgi:hypothetical protein